MGSKPKPGLAGVVALAKFTTTPVRVIVQLTTVWEAWHQPKSRAPYQDILQKVTDQDYGRITVLYISRNTRTPEAPGNEPQLRRRQRDCALAAWERAKTFQDHWQTEWQATLDEDHCLIYKHAVQRLSKIFDDPDGALHPPKSTQAPRQTDQRFQKRIGQTMHQPHRSGYQCMACGTRMHQGLTKNTLETRLQEECPQILIEDACQPSKAPTALPAKKPTRAQVIKDLLHQQTQEPPAHTERQYAETTGYLKCLKCGINIHKRINEPAFQQFITSQCIDQVFTDTHPGHTSHKLWQKGDRVRCTQCGTQWNLDGERRVISTQALLKPCKGAGMKASPPLSDYFKKSTEGGTTPANDSQANSQSTASEPQLDTRPTPRRLRFPTQLDSRDATSEDEGTMAVDYF